MNTNSVQNTYVSYAAEIAADSSANLCKTDRQLKKKESQDNYKKTLEENQSVIASIKNTFKQKKTLSYDAAMDLSALANTCKTNQVRNFCGKMQRKITSFKKSGADSAQIQTAVVRAKRVLKKARIKLKKLQQEEALDKRRKKAELQQEKEKERKLRTELEGRRRMRKTTEYNDILEAKKGGGCNAPDTSTIDIML